MSPKTGTRKQRADALAQLKEAQQMLEDGNSQLALAQKQIQLAHKLIDNSAEVLRETSGHSDVSSPL